MLSSGGDTIMRWVQSLAGTTLNSQPGVPASRAMAIQGGTGLVNNGAYVEITFNAASWRDVALSFAARRSTTGFSDIDIDAYDGTTLLCSLLPNLNLNPEIGFQLIDIDASILDGVADARIRMTLNGATNAFGNVRLDNLLIIPTPGATALLCLAGVLSMQRRR